jgi:hypothetical protein
LKDQNITLKGFFDNEYIEFATISLKRCNNETDGGICAPNEEMDNFMKSFKEGVSWNLYFQNLIVNSKDYSDPVKRHILNLYKLVQLISSKVIFMYIGPDLLKTDKGLLFEGFEYENSLAFDRE